MGKLYIFGHLNPDTDSIVAAMAYAELKKSLGEKTATAVRLGSVSPETSYVLQDFGFEEPPYFSSARAQVHDILFDMPPCVHEDVPIRTVWEIMSANGIKTIPVTDLDGKLLGVCTAGDIAEATLKSVYGNDEFKTSVQNLSHMLSGRLICGVDGMARGEIRIATSDEDLRRLKGIVLAEWREGIEMIASSAVADTVILCQAHTAAHTNGTCRVIATPYDLFRSAKLASQSAPVGLICCRDNLVTFTTEDYIDDVTKVLMSSRYRSYPILNAEGRIVGAISRIHLINHAKKRVILVDHNEKNQSVAGLEQAEICEIIDHHRLGGIQTGTPMYFRNEPVGSTTTIIAGMYKEYRLTPEPNLAKLMLAAILSDTVVFRSPTCTERDRLHSKWLAETAEVDAEELGKHIFTSLSEKLMGMSASQIFFQDFKEYSLGGQKIGIGQVTCWEINLPQCDEIQELMDALLVKERFDLLLFMKTEIMSEGTMFLHAENDRDLINQAFGLNADGNSFFMRGIMSRKKQVIPALAQYLM